MGLEKDLKTIKDAELDIELLVRKNDKLCEENNKEICDLETTIKMTEDVIEAELKASGKDEIECKLGSAIFKKMPDEWVYQDEILMAWIISLPRRLKNLYLKITTTVKKGNLKKQIIDYNDGLFKDSKIVKESLNPYVVGDELFLHTEERDFKVEGIEIKRQDKKFSYTIKKLKK